MKLTRISYAGQTNQTHILRVNPARILRDELSRISIPK